MSNQNKRNKKKWIKRLIKDYPVFYQKVWLACLDIPKGKVITYKELAKMINNPKAYRAVGNALNKNPLPEIIPCHRVIRSDGNIGGYSRGIKKKIRLLKIEGIKIKDGKVCKAKNSKDSKK